MKMASLRILQSRKTPAVTYLLSCSELEYRHERICYSYVHVFSNLKERGGGGGGIDGLFGGTRLSIKSYRNKCKPLPAI